MSKRKPKTEYKPKSEREIDTPYGWVLVLRGLARAAIKLSDRPAALRVLCVAAQYMNQDGDCRLGQDTIAAHLGITRQAANKHLAVLDHLDILISEVVKDGILKTYRLDTCGLAYGREGQQRVDDRRAAKRAAKVGEPVALTPPPPPRLGLVASAPPPKIAEPAAERPVVGSMVFHQKFGRGTVLEINENKLTIAFATVGEKKVVDMFVELIQ